jgi:murein DD-endopeptidase MepM/ murein hydrolase activator NlpD
MTNTTDELALSDLGFGFLNPVTDGRTGNSTDLRRSDFSSWLRASINEVYATRALTGVDQFQGIILQVTEKESIAAGDREAVLEKYAKRSWYQRKPADNSEELRPVCKVLIPELECRPVPYGFDDPIITTYYDVYVTPAADKMIGRQPLLGSIVTVKFGNTANFADPRIIRIGKQIAFHGVDPTSNTDAGRNNPSAPAGAREHGATLPVGDRAPLPPPTDEEVPSERGLLPNGSPQASYPGGSPPYMLPINASRMKSDRMYLNNTINPVTGQRQKHHAVDHGARQGTPILAIADGEVTYTRAHSAEGGNYIVMRHADVINGGNIWVRQLHMSRPTTLRVGDQVTKGQIIGYVGSTGRSTGPHIHFEIGKTYPGTFGGHRSKSVIDHKINPIGYYPRGWFVTKSGKAYTFPDQMRSTPNA